MNLTIEQMREIVGGAPAGAIEVVIDSEGVSYGIGLLPLIGGSWYLVDDLRAAIADHDRTDDVSDIRNHIAPTTRVIEG